MSPLAQGRPWGESLPSAGVRWFLLPAACISKSYRSFPPAPSDYRYYSGISQTQLA